MGRELVLIEQYSGQYCLDGGSALVERAMR
jgi:hypothetical protein